MQKLLDAPVWYLNYSLALHASGTHNGRTSSVERIINGTVLLGLRTQGPSLSIVSGDAKVAFTTPEDFEFFVGNYANWISGILPDESKTEEQQDAAQAVVVAARAERVAAK